MPSDRTKRKAVIPVSEIQSGDDIKYRWTGNRFRVGDVILDDESGYVYVALLDCHSEEFEQLDHFKPGADVTVYTDRPVDTDADKTEADRDV
jgi:uncharacterized Fe-S cluster-containing protein